MRPCENPDGSDFAERFIAELQARIYLDFCLKGRPLAMETPWNLPLLASFADPTFSASEMNGLPEAQKPADNPQNQGVSGG